MRRLRAAGAVIVICLAPGLPAVAQEGSPVPAAPVYVTGTESCGDRSSPGRRMSNGVEHARGEVAECVDTMSDPRVDGAWVNTMNGDCFGAHTPCFLWGTHVLDGPEGGWQCSWSGTDFPVSNGYLLIGVCPGTGGYEGLTYVFQHGTEDFGDGTTFHGYIYEGRPMWEPLVTVVPDAARW
jgi:hypothetical protein